MNKILFTFILSALTLTCFAQMDYSSNAGKIWIHGSQLFINAPGRGVQVMDNSNTRRPESIGFVGIPGNMDMAVIDNLMFANHFEDLVVFDWEAYINNQELVEKARFEGLFPNYANLDNMQMGIGDIPSNPGGLVTQGGSMACFTFDNPESPRYLYAVNPNQIHVFDVKDPEEPAQKSSVSVENGGDIETAFVESNRLYLGMPDGVLIYSLDNPERPRLEGRYEHLTGCDPVVADGGRAYATVRSGSRCNNRMPVNQLHVIDLSNASTPRSIGNFQLSNPHGLGIDGNLAFICDGDAGLKILDVTNPQGIRILGSENTSGRAYDLIVRPDRRELIVVSGDNISQYRYTATGSLTKLGEFALEF